jgi:ATP-dependent protease ClpP protease subunit
MNNEIHLFGTVGSDIFGDDFFTARQVRGMLAGMRGPVTVRLNSGGGIATEGQAIYHALKDHPGEVTVLIEGAAASAASLLAMAGDRIVMRRGSWLLIHDPASMFSTGRGTADDHARTAAMLAKIGEGYAQVYAAETGRSLEDVQAIMREESVFTGSEAVAAGFAHETEDLEAVAAADFPYFIYSTAPAELRAASQARHGATFRDKTAIMATIAGTARITHEDKDMTEAVQAAETAEQNPAPRMSARKLNQLHQIAERMRLDSSVVTEAVEAGKDFDGTLDAINAAWVDAGHNAPHMHGLTNSEAVERDRTVSVRGSWEQGAGLRAKMQDALLARMDRTHEPTMGRDFANLSLAQMADVVVRAEGHKPWNVAEAVRMAASHSTSDFPLILENSMTNLVARGMEQRQPDLMRATHEIRREDYRPGKSLTLSATGMPQPVNEGGEIQFVSVEEKGETLPTVRDFASGFAITNTALTNDRLDLLNDMGKQMVKGAVERLRAVLLEPLEAGSGAGHDLADGNAVFHSTRNNLADSGATISVTSLSVARTAMRKQRGINGELYAVEPWALVVPAELETVAQQVVAQITAAKVSETNPFAGSLEIIVEPGLSDPKAWYVVGNPARYDGLAVAYLDGQSSPRVESKPGWHTLGMELRLVWALDARFIEAAAWYRNPGDSGGGG